MHRWRKINNKYVILQRREALRENATQRTALGGLLPFPFFTSASRCPSHRLSPMKAMREL